MTAEGQTGEGRGSGRPVAGGAVPLPRGRVLDLSVCRVMGILNATPDSFSDGGELDRPGAVRSRIQALLDAGVEIFDVGGESTRPGHTPVPADEETRRVLPVIEAIRRLDAEVPISIDTRKGGVADAALRAGADLVNDVSGLGDPAMAEVVRRHGCPLVLMRHRDLSGDMVAACRDELAALLDGAVQAGVDRKCLLLDPGLGFGARPGPSVEDNLALVDGIADYHLDRPVVIGASRKRFVGAASGITDPARRAEASAEVAVRAARAGAAIVRVHDVGPTLTGLQAAGLR